MKSTITFIPSNASKKKAVKVELPFALDFLTEQDLRLSGSGRYGLFGATLPVKVTNPAYEAFMSIYEQYATNGLDRVLLENYTTHVTFRNCSMVAYTKDDIFSLELLTTADQVTGL